jgi:S-layer protein
MANDTATSADGALILNNLANNGTVELNGEGNVEVGVTDADTGTADSLNLVGNAAKGVVTAADVETVNIDAAAGDSTFVLTADSVETIVITGDEFVNLTDAADYASAALGDASSIVNTGNSLTMIDASAMTDGGIVAATSLAEQTIKGGAGADYLTADNGKAVIEGGAGDDTIYVTDGATSAVIDGGAGADTFDITGAALGVEAFATFMLNAASFSSEAVDMTLDDPSTSDWINAAFSQTSADESIWFQHNGNTYIAVNDATSGDDAYDAADVVVKLTGLVDLSAASFNDAGTLELA